MFKRLIASLLCLTFSFSNLQYVHAQDFSVNQLPVPGTMIGTSAPFAPLALKGLVVNIQKPLEFQFIVDTGRGPQDTASIKEEANQLVKYFLAGLTIPEGDLWVNLSPYEKDRMVPTALGQTDLGRDLLAQDYILKQLTASLIYPEKDLGKEFWSRVYAKAQAQFGTTNVPVNTFNKVWILPDQAQVFENHNAAYVTKSTLKVMLDEDYLAKQKHQATQASSVSSQIVREIVIPEITKEVNTGKNFAPLRQIYQALILAKWYRETIQNGLLDAVYTNKSKVAGVNLADPAVKEQIYERYLKAYKKGAFNYIKEDPTPDGQVMPRKYFSGGAYFAGSYEIDRKGSLAMISSDGAMEELDISLQKSENSVDLGRRRTIKALGAGLALAGIAALPGGKLLNAQTPSPKTLQYAQEVNLLIQSAELGDKKSVEHVLANGMDVNVVKDDRIDQELRISRGDGLGSESSTALMAASYNGHMDIVKMLIAKGADINVKNHDGATALVFALREYGDSVLNDEAIYGNEHFEDSWHLQIDSKGIRDYLMKIGKNKIDIAVLLINKGSDLNGQDYGGNTALMYAIHMAQGAYLDWKGLWVNTALMNAIHNGYTNVIKLLLEKGADVNVKSTFSGNTALMFAQDKDIVEKLLAKGADVNAKNKGGSTALMGMWDKDIVELLLSHGADVNAKDNDGGTALSRAIRWGHQDIVDILIAHGAKDHAMSVPTKKPYAAMGLSLGLGLTSPNSSIKESLEQEQAREQRIFERIRVALDVDSLNQVKRTRIYLGKMRIESTLNVSNPPMILSYIDDGERISVVEARERLGFGVNRSRPGLIEFSSKKDLSKQVFLLREADEAMSVIDQAKAKFQISVQIPALKLARNVEKIETMLSDKDEGVRTAAEAALKELEVPKEGMIAAYLEVLQLGAEDARVNAVNKLVDLGGEPSIIKVFGKDSLLLKQYIKERYVKLLRIVNKKITGEEGKVTIAQMKHEWGISTRAYALKIEGRKFEEEGLKEESYYGYEELSSQQIDEQIDRIISGQEIFLQDRAMLNSSMNRRDALRVIGGGMAVVLGVGLKAFGQGISTNTQKLMNAAENGDLPTVQGLLDSHPDIIDARAVDGTTALMLAAWKGNIDVVKLLLARGADVNAIDEWGQTALTNLSQDGDREDIARLLIEKGANVNAQDGKGWTALMCASFYGRANIAKLLLEHNANVNLKAKVIPKEYFGGETALILASSESRRGDLEGKVTVVGLLLNHKADFTEEDAQGHTASWNAKAAGYTDIVQILKDRGADQAMLQTTKNGGIDLNKINVLRKGKTVNVQFDQAQLNELMQGGFEGFTPVIIDMTPISSPLPLLGINTVK